MVSYEMINVLNNVKDLLDAALDEKAKDNFYGAGQLIRQYDNLVGDELDYWHVGYDYVLQLGLVVETAGLV